MYGHVLSGGLRGIESFLVRVEADVSNGLPCMEMVGLLAGEVREAKERVRVAMKNTGLTLPVAHITVSLSPADVRKAGNAYDLPIAVAILLSMGKLPERCAEKTLIVGELGLDGELRPVSGVLPMVMRALKEGVRDVLVPLENGEEAAMLSEARVFPAQSLKEATELLRASEAEREKAGEKMRQKIREIHTLKNSAENTKKISPKRPDFSEVKGQSAARRAAEIAAAGFHHLLLVGSPGAGKTMIASRLSGILPPLSMEEALEVTAIRSVAGLVKQGEGIARERPFLAPHHTVTKAALTGGGMGIRPGALSLAHKGVLFLDELTEIRREILDVLRQPLEEKKIRLSRGAHTVEYPADILFVGAMNPCPCGYYPDRSKCRCTDSEVRRYLGRISGPLLDRIDLCVETSEVGYSSLRDAGEGESSEKIRRRVERAVKRQQQRYAGTGIRFNAELGVKDTDTYCSLGKAEERLLKQAFEKKSLSARAFHRLLRVARTIADLDDSDRITTAHLSEAVGFRSMGAG